MNKRLRIYSIILLTIFTIGCCFLTGCDKNSAKEKVEVAEEKPLYTSFEKIDVENIGSSINIHIYRDKTTDVLYQAVVHYEGIGLTTMLHPEDGTPLLYSEYKEMLKKGNTTTE